MIKRFAAFLAVLLCLSVCAAAEEAASSAGLAPLWGEWEYDMNERLVIEGERFRVKCQWEYLLDTGIVSFDDTADEEGRRFFTLEEMATYENDRKTSDILRCWLVGDEIHLVQEYVFGERESVYRKTDKKEFYYYDLVTDEFLPGLQGMWTNGDFGFLFEGNQVRECYQGEPFGEAATFCVVRENLYENGRVFVTDENLYVTGICAYSMLELRGNTLTGCMMVLDADTHWETFSKQESR